ncbi:hypothetical protein TrLO_g10367 [Triparma laevis f. longispina]|uniref:Uncharacterized protein n=1 Tax=Triparma laevis f. longispina TaxID=1714387 RepID=A0A9W6ZLC4_9STRA|nr:hypothetical protein TrLO_g10367 [Triparma laevis f. longispina]
MNSSLRSSPSQLGGVIDERRKKDFIENIDNAPALTKGEQDLIAGSMKLFEEVTSKAKRVAGTANESVGKLLYYSEKGGAAVGMSVKETFTEEEKEGATKSQSGL